MSSNTSWVEILLKAINSNNELDGIEPAEICKNCLIFKLHTQIFYFTLALIKTLLSIIFAIKPNN